MGVRLFSLLVQRACLHQWVTSEWPLNADSFILRICWWHVGVVWVHSRSLLCASCEIIRRTGGRHLLHLKCHILLQILLLLYYTCFSQSFLAAIMHWVFWDIWAVVHRWLQRVTDDTQDSTLIFVLHLRGALGLLLLRDVAVCSHNVLFACHLAGLGRCQSRKAGRIDIGCPVERACTETWESLLLDRLRINKGGSTKGSVLPLLLIRDSLAV